MKTFKKTSKSDTMKNQKRVSFNPISAISLTQEIRIPISNNDIKGLGKSLQLKNTIRIVDTKKNVADPYKKRNESRKPANRSKKCKTGESQELRTITEGFKTLKQLTLSRSKSHSKSKSPASLKHPSTKKSFHKKESFKLNPNPVSGSSSLKLQSKLNKTSLKKIVQSNSGKKSSEPFYNISLENEESTYINEVKNYCTQMNNKKKTELLFIIDPLSFERDRAASKIQRAWRRYQTKLLIERYSSEAPNRLSKGRIFYKDKSSKKKQQQNLQSQSKQIVVTFQNFQKLKQEHYLFALNNNSSVGESVSYEDLIQQFKREQINRWNDIINIISLNKNNPPEEISRLLQKLVQQSEQNKKNLEAMSYNRTQRTYKKEQIKTEPVQQILESNRLKKEPKKGEFISSEHSLEFNQYDNKKYIQFLDSDVFPNFSFESPKSSRNTRISKSKQDLLLELLKKPKDTHQSKVKSLHHSLSLTNLRQINPKSTKTAFEHRRSISQRVKQLQSQVSKLNQSGNEDGQTIGIDKLIENFLKYSGNNIKEQAQSCEERLRTKMAELNQIKNAYQTIQFQSPKSSEEQEEQQEEMELRRSQPGFRLNPINENFIINIITDKQGYYENHDSQIQSQSQEDDDDGEKDVKCQTCVTIIIDKLVLEAIQQIYKFNFILKAFKSYLKEKKSKPKPRHKKGFQTSKAAIQVFLTNLLKFVEKQQPDIFKNLEVSTGPTALQMLRFMHTQIDDQQNSDEDEAAIMVLPNRIFDAFWSFKQQSLIIDYPEGMDQSTTIFHHHIQLLTSLNKIFIRCLFDTFNECLDHQRNFGQFGRPFPWKRCPAFEHRKSEKIIQDSVDAAKKRMIELSIIYCGLIVEKEDLHSIGEESLKQIHEDRLKRMLTNDSLQMESRWIIYDDEQTQILVEISHLIGAELLLEGIQELCSF